MFQDMLILLQDKEYILGTKSWRTFTKSDIFDKKRRMSYVLYQNGTLYRAALQTTDTQILFHVISLRNHKLLKSTT